MVEKGKAILFGPLPPPYGGVSVFMDGLYQAVIERGGKVWTYTGDRERYSANPIYVDHRRIGHILAAFRNTRNGRITDSTHFHFEYPHLFLLPLWLITKRVLGFRWVKLLHDGSLPFRHGNFGVIQKCLFRAALRNADEFVAASDELASWLVDVEVPRSRISIIPTLLPRVAEDIGEPAEISNVLKDVSRHKQTVCSVGIFIPSYGFHHIAEAVERVRNVSKMDIGLTLIDGTFARDDCYREQVLRDRDWITVIENVPNPDIPDVLNRCDAFIRATEHEGLGISRVEALWSDVPVIATDVGERRGMFVYDFGDIEALSDHIRSVLKGGVSPGARESALTLRREAQQNLDNYIAVIMGDR